MKARCRSIRSKSTRAPILSAIPDEDFPNLQTGLAPHYQGESVGKWALQFLDPAETTGTMKLLRAMNHGIQEQFTYGRRTEKGVQTPEETLRRRQGSCRDFAVLMMEAARSLGIAARFVSGYIFTPSAGANVMGGGATHAWIQAYLPGAGWIDFDPTNSIVGNRNLIRVAVAWSPENVLPLWGTLCRRSKRLLNDGRQRNGHRSRAMTRVLRPQGSSRYVLFCDHASNHVPEELDNLGLPESELARHIAWDIGAAGVTEALSEILDAPAILCGTSRLVIDCNRQLNRPGLIPEVSDGTTILGNLNLTESEGEPHRSLVPPISRCSGIDSVGPRIRHHNFHPFHDPISRWCCEAMADRALQPSRSHARGPNARSTAEPRRHRGG